ncbi:transferase family-domain-containing protein [Aspergillus carlsbadensis]|nr:transferase family-domain-containing protein [Aspergillus carlsbadensis]
MASHTTHRFSPLDDIIFPVYFAVICGFPCEAAQRPDIHRALQAGYTLTLEQFPFLGADIDRVPHGDPSQGRAGSLRLQMPGSTPDTSIDVRDLTVPGSGWTHTYAELREASMPPSWLDPELLAPCIAGTKVPSRVFDVQINWIHGGCLLTMYGAHAAADAGGLATIVEFWAWQCRHVQASSTHVDVDVDVDPSAIFGFGSHVPALHDLPCSAAEFDRLKSRPELWKLLGLHWEMNLAAPAPGDENNDDAPILPTKIPSVVAVPGMRSCIFSITPEAAARLKQDATPPDGNGWVSTNDAIAALVWRSVMRARFPDPASWSRSSIATVTVDGRSLDDLHIPPNYTGNVVFCCMTETTLTDLVSSTLAETASLIHRNVQTLKTNGSLQTDATRLAASIPDVRRLAIAFYDSFGDNLVTTSWAGLPFYGVDFGAGLGKPEFVRPPRGQFGGVCTFLPRRATGGVEVLLNLREGEMERVLGDAEFLRYAETVCG